MEKNYDYVMSLIKKCHEDEGIDTEKIYAVLDAEGIDMSENNEFLEQIIASFEFDYNDIDCTYSIYTGETDGDTYEFDEHECKVLTEYEVGELINDERDWVIDDVMPTIPVRARPFFDSYEYACEEIVSIFDIYGEDSFDIYEVRVPSNEIYTVIFEK